MPHRIDDGGLGLSELASALFIFVSLAERSEIVRIFNEEARAKRMERVKRIEWNNVSLVVDVAIMSVAISRVLIHREYARLHQGSLASHAHLC